MAHGAVEAEAGRVDQVGLPEVHAAAVVVVVVSLHPWHPWHPGRAVARAAMARAAAAAVVVARPQLAEDENRGAAPIPVEGQPGAVAVA